MARHPLYRALAQPGLMLNCPDGKARLRRAWPPRPPFVTLNRRPGRPTGTWSPLPWTPATPPRRRWPLGSTCEPPGPLSGAINWVPWPALAAGKPCTAATVPARVATSAKLTSVPGVQPHRLCSLACPATAVAALLQALFCSPLVLCAPACSQFHPHVNLPPPPPPTPPTPPTPPHPLTPTPHPTPPRHAGPPTPSLPLTTPLTSTPPTTLLPPLPLASPPGPTARTRWRAPRWRSLRSPRAWQMPRATRCSHWSIR